MGEADFGGARWLIGGSRSIYSSRWLDLQLVEVTPPGGDKFEHHVVRMQRVAICVVLSQARDAVLMLRRHRFVDDSWGWEAPIGIVEPGEASEDAAVREVEEETGWRPGPTSHVMTFQPAIGIADSPHDVYVAIGAEHIGTPLDRTEADAVAWVPVTDLLGMINDGAIRDGATLVGVLHLLASGSSA